MNWIEQIETYFNDIPLGLQAEVRDFLAEYYEKKDTHSASSLEGLSDEELGELLYLDLRTEIDNENIQKLDKCKKLKILKAVLKKRDLIPLENLTELRILDLDLEEISHALVSLSSLKKLLVFDVSISRIERLLEENFLPRQLLFFSINGIYEDYDFLDLPSNFSNLIYLRFYGLDFKKIPDLSWISNLVVLNIEENLIFEIPPYINRLKKLKKLDLWNCEIKELPKEFFELKQLKVLEISCNQLTFLPKELIELKQLEVLDLSHNQLTTLPNEILELPKLKKLIIFKNPFETPVILKTLDSLIIDPTYENDIFVLDILKNSKPVTEDYNYFTLKVPKILQTAMLQYIEFFKDYVEAAKGKDIIFDIKRDKEGLVLVTNGNFGITLLELGEYFQEYVALVGQNSEDWILNFEVPRNTMQADILHLKLDRQISSLKTDLNIAQLESKYLSIQLSDKEAQVNFLKELSNSLSQKIDKLIDGQKLNEPNANQLFLDLIDQAVKMLERKYTHHLEDLHNDILTDFLRQKGYYATDQTRSGRAKIGAGEIDIMIRKQNGTPYSIIEAFRLSSCGKDNKIVAQHLDKLIHNYDTAGHARNFVIVYAEAKNFERLWGNYTTYVSELNGKIDFQARYPLINFSENRSLSEKSSVKVGVAKHRREGKIVEIYHIFINMFGGLQ